MAETSERFERLAANVGEHFTDYVVLVRSKDGGMWSSCSNEAWARGAMNQLFDRFAQMGYDAERTDSHG
ncbi:MAG TPA: hypothetical protein VFN81_08645 [Sphingomicrobium sp.]|nr:hypothetical protein [Sphingomicrobium sp.]